MNAIDHIDSARSYNQLTYEDNNLKDSYAQTTKYIVYNSSNLSFEDLKKIYKNKIIIINMVTKSDKEIEYHYSIGKLLKES